MRKNILISGLTILGLIILIITYLNINGIKTNKLNDLINEKIKSVDSKLSLKVSSE